MANTKLSLRIPRLQPVQPNQRLRSVIPSIRQNITGATDQARQAFTPPPATPPATTAPVTTAPVAANPTEPDYTQTQEYRDTERSYGSRRQDIINSYQDALDAINLNLTRAGIANRSDYAGRNLYNAEGTVDATGQMVGADRLAPYLTSLAQNARNKATDLTNLEGERTASLANVIKGLKDTAAVKALEEKQKAEQPAIDAQNQQIETRNENVKAVTEQEKKGRVYLTSVKKLNEAKRKYGPDAVVVIGGKAFLKSPEERLALTTKKVALNKKLNPSTKPSTTGSPQRTSSGPGYAFSDAKGKPITAAKYASTQNKTIAEVLDGSNDPTDKDFVTQYNAGLAAGYTEAEVLKALKDNGAFKYIFGT